MFRFDCPSEFRAFGVEGEDSLMNLIPSFRQFIVPSRIWSGPAHLKTFPTYKGTIYRSTSLNRPRHFGLDDLALESGWESAPDRGISGLDTRDEESKDQSPNDALDGTVKRKTVIHLNTEERISLFPKPNP
jgi:hypothetical protein